MWEVHNDFVTMLQQVWQNEPKAANLKELEQNLTLVAEKIGTWGIHSIFWPRETRAKKAEQTTR